MQDTNMTLDDRAELERLLTEHARCEARVNQAIGERHNATHALIDFVNKRTRKAVEAVATGEVPTGTKRALHDAEVVRGARHERADAPIEACGCATCCEVRALAEIRHAGAPTARDHYERVAMGDPMPVVVGAGA